MSTFQAASPCPLQVSAIPSNLSSKMGLKFWSLSWPINTVGEFKSSTLDLSTLIQKLSCCSFCRISSFSHVYFNIQISELNTLLEQYFQKCSFWSKNIFCSYFPAHMSIDSIKHFLFWELKQIWLLSPSTGTFAQQLLLEGWALCSRHSPWCSLHPPAEKSSALLQVIYHILGTIYYSTGVVNSTDFLVLCTWWKSQEPGCSYS